MASPRVFVSSTFYDLRQVRADLERFMREIGYDPVLHERGGIPYGTEEALEEYAYREVDLCDILISIVGGRFGTQSRSDEDYSISQKEVQRALRRGKQVYIFVVNAVLSEYRTWDLNQEAKDINYASVDDSRIFEFLSELYKLPTNNPITGFDDTAEITLFLKRQWAGLFQRLLAQSRTIEEGKTVERLTGAVTTMERLVSLLAEHQQSRSELVTPILLMEHPALHQVQKVLDLPYRIAFYKISELDAVAQGLRFQTFEDHDSEHSYQWARTLTYPNAKKKRQQILMVSRDLFDDAGDLRPMSPGDFDEKMVRLLSTDIEPSASPFDEDDDLPF